MTALTGPRAGAYEAPVIGLSMYGVPARWGPWEADAVLLPRAYVNAVSAAGGIPVLLPPMPGAVHAAMPRLDGLLLAGGPDIDPARYGAKPGPHTQPPSPDRDAAEAELVEGALDGGVPVLAICRGMQLLNVARGGSLHQHLPDLVGTEAHGRRPGVFESHPVRVAPGSRLETVLGRLEVDGVPTSHHQGIERIGSGLVPTAWAEDGTVEALEDPGLPFCLGVQWHPEMGDDPSLFHALVAAARTRVRV